MRLELQILVLLLLSVAMLVFHHLVPRTMVVGFSGDYWEFSSSHDEAGSESCPQVTDRGAELKMDVVNSSKDPYAAALFRRIGDNTAMNLDWFTKISLTAYIEGREEEYFRIQFRNRIPGIYNDDDPVSRQYNEALFELSESPQTLEFSKEHFHVPGWWAEEYGQGFDDSIASFNQVDAFEIITGSSVSETEVTLVVEEIKLVGHWIPPIVLYRTLLSSWMILALGVVLQKSLDLRQALRQSAERENRLRSLNVSLKSQATTLSQLAQEDALTGLLNRRGITQRIHEAMLREECSTQISLALLDIDNFKIVNDKHGHNFGDDVLTDLSKLFSFRENGCELFARWGGEEFLIVFFARSGAEAREYCEDLRTQIQNVIGITCSFGVCEAMPEEPFHDALERADRAMYEAKSRGRNKVVAYSEITPRTNMGASEPASQFTG
ncbi:GGDEF domain-containing protein [Mariniblastus fucicola]|uniref:diguanylate cyclase n=1 Tax=Mariniblastus fucicola TaxID=980251 RepID=A0A5B9PC03_9BACT|nr:GGDEF domain-containing protein [Mariniblastus fucicola]QEG22580.1 Diguanylate cyclase YdeH [Mariniblastus fucicola]